MRLPVVRHRHACAKRLSGAAAATDSASTTSSTSRSVSTSLTLGTGADEGLAGEPPGARRRHRHPVEMREQVRSTHAEHPPAAVDGRSEDGGVRGRAGPGPGAAVAASRCGVSMPTWTTGAPERVGDVLVGVAPAAARSPRPAGGARVQSAVAASSSSARSRGRQVAVEGEVAPARRRTPPRTRPGCRAAPPPRARRRAPCRPPRPSRVLTCPATGAFATTSTTAGAIAGLTRAPGRSRGRRGPCPRTEPDTLERVPAARGW